MAKPSVTFAELRRSAQSALREVGIESANIDCKILLSEASGLTASDLIANANETVPNNTLKRFNSLLERRVKCEPIAYITGRQGFWSLDFKVTPDVLIPRPETEGVVERALSLMARASDPIIADIGTGSGAILLSLLHERKDATGIGVDISLKALDVAKTNAERVGVADRVKFFKSDYLASIDQRVHMVVSNPPYITNKAMCELPISVGSFEPSLALSGGKNGLVAYQEIAGDVRRILRPGGVVVFEIGYDQGEAVSDLLAQHGFQDIRIDKDLAGHDRVVSGNLSA